MSELFPLRYGTVGQKQGWRAVAANFGHLTWLQNPSLEHLSDCGVYHRIVWNLIPILFNVVI